jgi:hypothetical protein
MFGEVLSGTPMPSPSKKFEKRDQMTNALVSNHLETVRSLYPHRIRGKEVPESGSPHTHISPMKDRLAAAAAAAPRAAVEEGGRDSGGSNIGDNIIREDMMKSRGLAEAKETKAKTEETKAKERTGRVSACLQTLKMESNMKTGIYIYIFICIYMHCRTHT